MKRFVVLFLTLILCVSVLAVPAFAAEPDEYIFEIFEPVSLYADYEFFPTGSTYTSAACQHRLPEGLYDVYVFDFDDGDGFVLLCDSVTVDYSYLHEMEDATVPYSLSLVDLDGYTYELCIYDMYDVYGVTMLALFHEDTTLEIMVTVKFVPVDTGSLSLSDYISPDILGNVLTEVIAVLPIAILVLVAYIAIRKGIFFLLSFLNKS